jgi:hypothetical protein
MLMMTMTKSMDEPAHAAPQMHPQRRGSQRQIIYTLGGCGATVLYSVNGRPQTPTDMVHGSPFPMWSALGHSTSTTKHVMHNRTKG